MQVLEDKGNNLLHAGRIAIRTQCGSAALHLAARHRNNETVQLLGKLEPYMELRSCCGSIPHQLPAGESHTDTMKALAELEADV
mmetsp:Transcript_14101/g.27093  ORF Transcript_14101/g.27093 Transcript_14101/m.27093 type:complete len:84 (-) Transcript_14101:219-470(-)|eukprot:CAMPEP_0114256426 /NCGR_PEP_ID=MMETSP0058-20121206/18144_1 /TAXON_ID=36894 /ORGANISM="Pyramimonas parkeae, CCMP726" /LENGTH=83 /DNA_ID=CAMNT_0001370987 /DNA_START=517 /DNA_END=768 /DNA_ORIENTATION=+